MGKQRREVQFALTFVVSFANNDETRMKMKKYPWWTQYLNAIQAEQPNQFACIDVAESKIYDRLEDSLQGRQCLDSAEWQPIGLACWHASGRPGAFASLLPTVNSQSSSSSPGNDARREELSSD